MLTYLRTMSRGQMLLWSYFITYLVIAVRFFEASLHLWVTAAIVSAFVGTALYVSAAAVGKASVKLSFWQTVRMYLTPFCVSSFSALIKGKSLALMPPDPAIQGVFAALAAFFAVVALVKSVK